jgi:hypothetical protein
VSFRLRASGTHLCADRLTRQSNEDTAALVHAAGTTRPAGAAAAATPGTGDGLRCAAVSPAEGGEERDRSRRSHALAVLTLNGGVSFTHRSQGIKFRTTVFTVILV